MSSPILHFSSFGSPICREQFNALDLCTFTQLPTFLRLMLVLHEHDALRMAVVTAAAAAVVVVVVVVVCVCVCVCVCVWVGGWVGVGDVNALDLALVLRFRSALNTYARCVVHSILRTLQFGSAAHSMLCSPCYSLTHSHTHSIVLLLSVHQDELDVL
jgi:hypothetical protein